VRRSRGRRWRRTAVGGSGASWILSWRGRRTAIIVLDRGSTVDDITGRVALITGGNRGIGSAIGLALARAGVDVAFCYRSRRDEAEATAKAIEDLGRRAFAMQADVSIAADVSALVEGAQRALGPIDILVNNAGE